MMIDPHAFRIRSYIHRASRMTAAQTRAYLMDFPQYEFSLSSKIKPQILEIGFGSGQSLLAAAEYYPNKQFVGVETHKPGIGALLIEIVARDLKNIQIFSGDVIDALNDAIPNESLEAVLIFFPDPWPKRKHHPRRLIQSSFIQLLLDKMEANAVLHLATDWEDYAKHMMKVLSQESGLLNMAGVNQYADRSCYRPVVTKFEKRAHKEGRPIWELQFKKRLNRVREQ